MRTRPLAAALHRALFGATVLAFVAAVPAARGADDAATETAADAPVDGTQPTKLGSVVVTAQSRAQEVQEVPIALQIVDAQAIERVEATDLSRMDLFVPGLVVDGSQPTQPHYALRGISTDDFGVGTDPAVGVYVDGVYAARSGGALLAFNDVKRIEVLKGPQGTLFGRNTAAGAISIVTNEPGDKFEDRVRLRFGEYGKRYGDALLNAPIGDDMALRVCVLDNQGSGWLKDAATGRHYTKDDDWGTRAAWRWNAPGNTKVILSWDHEKLDQPPRPAIGVVAQPPLGELPPFPPDPATYIDPRHAPLYNDAIGAAETRRFDGVTLSVDHAFGWGSLVSTTAFRDFTTLNREDNDGTNRIDTYFSTANIEDNRSWYQEFKFSGANDRADWVAGASYYHENAKQTSETNVFTDSIDTLVRNVSPAPTPDGSLYSYLSQVLAANGLPFSLLGDPWQEAISNRGRSRATALFGDVIWHLNERWNLTTGARYTHDSKRFSWFNGPRRADALDATVDALEAAGFFDQAGIPADLFRQNVIFNTPGIVGQTVSASDSWNDFSPRVVLDYRFTPDVMGFVSATKGYKAGGYNSVQIGSHFEPEKVRNFEAGAKSVFPDAHLLLNASVYYYQYDNRQSLRLDPNAAGSGVPRYLVDSSDQDAKGVDAELQWQPVDPLRFNLVAAYIDARYKNKVTAEGVDLSDEPTGEPRLSLAGGASYVWHEVFDGDVTFTASYAYRGRTRCNADSALQGDCLSLGRFKVGEAQHRTDLRLGWNAADGRWGAAVFVNNVFDDQYVRGIDNVSASVFGTPYATITPPRMWGVEVRASF